MGPKGGVSVPAMIAVSIIIVAIIIGLFFILGTNTKTKLEAVFGATTQAGEDTACSKSGPLGGILCPGGS